MVLLDPQPLNNADARCIDDRQVAAGAGLLALPKMLLPSSCLPTSPLPPPLPPKLVSVMLLMPDSRRTFRRWGDKGGVGGRAVEWPDTEPFLDNVEADETVRCGAALDGSAGARGGDAGTVGP